MAQSTPTWRRSLSAFLAAVGLAFATQAGARATEGAPPIGAGRAAPVSLMVDPGACKPGFVEGALNDWLVWTGNAEFESDYAALAFDELVDFVYLLRNLAQDFCV